MCHVQVPSQDVILSSSPDTGGSADGKDGSDEEEDDGGDGEGDEVTSNMRVVFGYEQGIARLTKQECGGGGKAEAQNGAGAKPGKLG